MGRQPPSLSLSLIVRALSLTKSPKSLRILCAIFVNMFPAQRFALCLAQPALIWYTYIYVTIYMYVYHSISSASQHYRVPSPCAPASAVSFVSFLWNFSKPHE